MADASETKAKPNRPLQVLCLGLPRTGTYSLYEALTQLGYKDVHHGLINKDEHHRLDGKGVDLNAEWRVWDRATDAAFPTLPSYTGKPLSRAEWDELLGPCEATTDIAALFGPQLIEAYPDAKVVLVERDVDQWLKSMEEVLASMFSWPAEFFITKVEPYVLGSLAGPVSRKLWLGWTGAKDGAEVRRNLRQAYENHYRRIKEMLPKDRLLEFKLADGWAPLCAFLGKEVPDTEFPHTNDAAAFKQFVREATKKGLIKMAVMLAPWVAGLGAVAVAYRMF